MNAKELEEIITESVNKHTTVVMSQLWGVDEETVLDRVMTAKQYYLSLLVGLPTHVIQESMANPTDYMTRTHILLHGVVLRRRGAEIPKLEVAA